LAYDVVDLADGRDKLGASSEQLICD